MRSVAVSAIFLLVVVMCLLDTGYADILDVCGNETTTECEEKGWKRLDDTRCMMIIPQSQTFSDAKKSCKALGGALVSILNDEQNDKVACYTYETYITRLTFWIGAKRNKNGFKWIDGSGPMIYSNWDQGQPDDWMNKENCVEINHTTWGSWNDLNCKEKRLSVCAKEM